MYTPRYKQETLRTPRDSQFSQLLLSASDSGNVLLVYVKISQQLYQDVGAHVWFSKVSTKEGVQMVLSITQCIFL